MPEQITLYTNKGCPWAHRVELALKESKLDYTRFEVDLQNKPVWYAPKINPASKVPAISYGGPQTDPSTPSPSSEKIAESYVLLEFFADLAPHLLPSDPVTRAKARFFIETTSTKFIPKFLGSFMRGEDPAQILEGAEALQALLPKEGGFAVGEWSIADAAITPFLARAEVAFKNDFGSYEEGAGRKAWEALTTDAKFERFRQYFADLKKRESFKQTFDEGYLTEIYGKRSSDLRAQKAAAAKA